MKQQQKECLKIARLLNLNTYNISRQVGHASITFITNVFPQEIATGNIHNGIIAGKLNGAIPAVTPRGSR